MQTSSISFRVADFLKQYAPFQFMTQDDLLGLASGGRVRFYEADEFLLWQGSAHSTYVLVVQQGTVSLVEEKGGREILRDIVGPGDILALDRLSGLETNRYSAKSQSEVVVYALPAAEFDRLVAKYPQAGQYIGAQVSSSAAYTFADAAVGVHQIRLADIPWFREELSCASSETVRAVSKRMAATQADALAVLDGHGRFIGAVTTRDILQAIGGGDIDPDAPIQSIVNRHAITIHTDVSVSEAALLMAETRVDALALTRNGERASRFVTLADLVPSFGDQPSFIFRDILRAPGARELRALQERLHAFVLTHLSSPATVDWLSRLTYLASCRILGRIMELNPPPERNYCWCYFGPSGRQESMVPMLPPSVLILENTRAIQEFTDWRAAILETVKECGYLSPDTPFDAVLSCADTQGWKERFEAWVRDPVLTEMYRARPLFDMRPIATDGSSQALWEELNTSVLSLIRRESDFLPLLAHDCLANLPPITFFRDLVVEESGQRTDVFQLKQAALLPLVDVGRVFGLAAGGGLGVSTLDRFAAAARFLPGQAALFDEASETLRVVLALQTRVGIRQHTAGYDLPPAMLNRYDRQVLKRGFRSILRLLEFTQNYQWTARS